MQQLPGSSARNNGTLRPPKGNPGRRRAGAGLGWGASNESLNHPVRPNLVIVVDRAAAAAPIIVFVNAVFRRALELRVRDVDFIAFEPWVVGQQRPRQRVIVFADAHEPAEAHDRVADLAALLADHHTFDPADFLPVGSIDSGPLDLVAGDERMRFPHLKGPTCMKVRFYRHLILPKLNGVGVMPKKRVPGERVPSSGGRGGSRTIRSEQSLPLRRLLRPMGKGRAPHRRCW